MKVVIVTSKTNPLVDGELLLPKALLEAGYDTEVEPWDDESVLWNRYDYAIIRTTWNYVDNPEAFKQWLARVSNETTVLNDPDLIKWNMNKRYLFDLEKKGIRIIPTVLVADEVSYNLSRSRYGSTIVNKPLIGNSAIGVTRRLVSSYKPNEEYLAQPFIPQVSNGVVSVIFFGGALSHTIRSIPAPNDFRTQPRFGARDEIYEPSASEIMYCKKLLSTLPELPLYARIDYILDSEGPMLLELELIEPYLFFEFSNNSTLNLITALNSKITRTGSSP